MHYLFFVAYFGVYNCKWVDIDLLEKFIVIFWLNDKIIEKIIIIVLKIKIFNGNILKQKLNSDIVE